MLRTRLFLNLVPFVVILLAVGVYAIALFSRLTGSVDLIVSENYRSVVAAQQMSVALAGMDKGMLLWREMDRDNGKAKFTESQKHFEENLHQQLKRMASPAVKELSGQLATNYYAFQRTGNWILSLRQLKFPEEEYDREMAPRLLEMKQLLERITDLNNQSILATRQSLKENTRDVTRLMIIGIVVALTISGIACYYLVRSIMQPIQSLTKATREVGEGNLDQLVAVSSKDELAQLAESFNKMAVQLQAYRQGTTEKIGRLHRTMESTLATFPDPIFVLDKEGRIELKNPAAEALEASLKLKGELPARLRVLIQKVLGTGENFLPNSFKEVVSFRFSGHEIFFLPRILAMRDKENVLIGVAVVLYDVTRFRLLDDVKTNLVATVSHELKTPLTSVRLVLHILLEKTAGALTPMQQDLLTAARDDAERLLRILNSLLDLTWLDEGNPGLHKEVIASADLVSKVMEGLRESVMTKFLKIKSVVDPDLPAVMVDRQRINHVFTNFINNAIKHSPPHGEITLRVAQVENNGVKFSVIDQGPGVPEEFQDRIFDRFFRVPGQTKRGVGLGLSIAREIVEAHGGQIGVRSQAGQGSEFYLVLPAVEREALVS
ncbi:MAG: HAMP domain-containing protein [Verrucomicrobia bacterium]|nr:HAMP domain-containing protein [Verrucomicrobiota bacterium]